MHITTHTVEQIFNSDKHKEVRALNMRDPLVWSPHCQCCKEAETVGKMSRRMNLDRIVTMGPYSADQYTGHAFHMPTSLDVRFGNLCNMKCIMCSPSFSNQWYDEYFEFYNQTTFGQANITRMVKDEHGRWTGPPELKWYEDPQWPVRLAEMAPYLTHIYITGGEPMLVPAHGEMLDMLVAEGHAKRIVLEYDTNASVLNGKIMERWSHFKQVELRCSMDGMVDQYELIRFPGKWGVFQQNVIDLKAYERGTNGKVRVQAVTSCFQLANAFDMVEQEEWCNVMQVPFHIRFLEGPEMHSIASLSGEAKTSLLVYYAQHLMDSRVADQIVNYLQDHMRDNPKPHEIKKFVKFMDYLDTTRGTNWKQVFPETYKMVERT